MSEEHCELLEKCGFFLNFKGNTEVARNGWINLFCQNKERSAKCERKKIRAQTGNPPVDNMAPNGHLIRTSRYTNSG